MPDLPPLIDSYAYIQTWARENAPGISFRPPANPAAIDNFSVKSGLSLPDDLRQVLLTSDGETRASTGMIGNWRILPVAEVQAAWGLLTKLEEKGAFIGKESETPPYIRHAWWRSGWIPIVESGAGDFYCLDTDPPETERSGQVLLFLRERPERSLVAGSLRAWFDRIARDLRAGVYTWDEENGFNGEAMLWSALTHKHLFDTIEGKLVVKE